MTHDGTDGDGADAGAAAVAGTGAGVGGTGAEVLTAVPGAAETALVLDRLLPARGTAVLVAGDSTAAAYTPDVAPQNGWGGALGARLPGPALVRDHAECGATTRSFRERGHWRALLLTARPGDVLLVQFGHNDQKHADLLPATGYRQRLAQYVHEARAAGLVPVLCTPVRRRPLAGTAHATGRADVDAGEVWNGAPEGLPPLSAYAAEVRLLAGELGTPLIDLHEAMGPVLDRLGPERSHRLYLFFPPGVHPHHPDGVADGTHFNATGAEAVADLVVQGLREAGLLGRLVGGVQGA